MKKRIVSAILLVSIVIAGNNATIKANHSQENRIKTYRSYCEKIGAEYDIAPELLEAIIYCESDYNPNERSGCNAQGLCQIIPKWQKERMKKLGITDLYDPYSNILCCADILDSFREKYGDDLYQILAYYNKGEYGIAKKEFENGIYTRYAIKVTEKAAELTEEKENGDND